MTKGLDEILSGDEPVQAEQTTAENPEITTETETQPRGPDGKFAPKAGDPEPVVETPATDDQQQSSRGAPPGVIEERNRRKSAEERAADLERQLAELRGSVATLTQQRQQPQPVAQPTPPPKKVEVWEDPDEWGRSLVTEALTPLQQELLQTRFELSMDRAIATHGEETVKAADAALKAAIDSGQLVGEQVKAQLSQSRSPVMEIVRWHQNQPATLEARLRAEIEAKVRAEMGGQQPEPAALEQPSTTKVMPSNLVGQRNVGTRSGPAWSGPAPINDIFDRARAKKAG